MFLCNFCCCKCYTTTITYVIDSPSKENTSNFEGNTANGSISDDDSSPFKAVSTKKGKRVIRDDSSDEEETACEESHKNETTDEVSIIIERVCRLKISVALWST